MSSRAPRAIRIAVFLFTVFGGAAVVEAAAPHGGGYLNPPGFVPRKKGPVGEGETKRPDSPFPTTPGNPGRPSPGSPPGVPGPAGPAGPAQGGGPRTGGGIVLEIDPTRWQDWWELNRDPYLRVREALRAPGAATGSDAFYMGAGHVRPIDTLAPTDAMVREDIAPRLRALLDADPHRDLATACMIALAKVGQDRCDFELVPLFAERLRDPDQEVRETAALALGLAGAEAAGSLLVDLATDSPAGRTACARTGVEVRVQAFAAYGLAIWARARDEDARRRAFDALVGVLGSERADRDLHVAAILGIGILKPTSTGRDRRLRDEAIEALRQVWDTDSGPAREVVRCHAATSIARLLDGAADTAQSSFHARRLAKTAADVDAGQQLRRAAVLAIGRIARGGALDDESQTQARDALLRTFETAKDLQTRYFALIALGGMGGEDERAYLLGVLGKGQRALERPWAAIALGVLCQTRRAKDGGEVDDVVSGALRDQLDAVKSPEARAAFAIGLGLCSDPTAADELRVLLDDLLAQDEIAGHICVGLALLRDARSIPKLREIVATSGRRPQRLREAAVALGALGDREASEILVRSLRDGEPTLAQVASISVGLGLIGDRRSIAPLLEIAGDASGTDLGRAFAVVAIGKIVERGDLPWSTPLAVGLNYRAAVETLVDGVRGILDVH